ncbi:MAG: energy transducer TonB, partial [Steroidobacteraceae bacterium]|nr:energy transducer TonB [Steroidobacteraceae bacterium]MDW8258130.1 hypothetical protein [Gammaproteobacteria bacterium]
FIYGAEETQGTNEPTVERSASFDNPSAAGRLNPDGERALQIAIDTLRKQQPVDRLELGDTLLDLGDWYAIGGNTVKANETYRLAYQELQAAGAAQKLAMPQVLAYRPPASSVQRARPVNPEEYEERTVEARLTIGPNGRVTQAVSVGGDAPEASVRATLMALRKARYRPRIEAGGPVEAQDVPHVERLLVRKTQPPAAPGKATSSTPLAPRQSGPTAGA